MAQRLDKIMLGAAVSWVLQAVAAAAFLAAGGAKLAGASQMVQVFEAVGIGQWLRYVTAFVEVGSAILLLVPGVAAYGALLLNCTMGCAALTHIFLIGGSPVPALILFVLTGAILWLRRTQLRPILPLIGLDRPQNA